MPIYNIVNVTVNNQLNWLFTLKQLCTFAKLTINSKFPNSNSQKRTNTSYYTDKKTS